MDKKAFVSMHAGVFFVVGLIIGLVLMYFLITKGIVPTGLIERIYHKMEIPKSIVFWIGNIIGLLFVLIGILLVLTLLNFNLPILGNINIILQYGAALGSILGGLSMLFKKKESTPEIKIKWLLCLYIYVFKQTKTKTT